MAIEPPSIALPAGAPPTVTVIVPAFNAEHTLISTLNSVSNQTLSSIEIIIVDDGSTDGTAEVAYAASSVDPRIKVISTANGGVAQARNTGLHEARSPYVATVDADDIWLPDKLELQVAEISKRPTCRLVYTWFATIDPDGRIIRFTTPTKDGWVLRDLLAGNFVGHASSPLMRREDLLVIGGFEAEFRTISAEGCEDLALYMRLAETGEVAVVHKVLTGYRLLPTSMSNRWRPMLKAFDIIQGRYRDGTKATERAIAKGQRNFFRYLCERAILAHDWGRFRDIASEAGSRSPLLLAHLLEPWWLGRALLPDKLRSGVRALLGLRSYWEGKSFLAFPSSESARLGRGWLGRHWSR